MDVKSILLGNSLSTTTSNFWDFLTKPGKVDCHLSPTSWHKLRPQGGAVPIITIRNREDVSMITIELPMSPGVLL